MDMGSFTVRKISDETKQSVREVAAKHGRSIEAELRALIEKTYGKRKPDDPNGRQPGETRMAYLLRIAPDCGPFDVPEQQPIGDPRFP